jgi:hypothetical protein
MKQLACTSLLYDLPTAGRLYGNLLTILDFLVI